MSSQEDDDFFHRMPSKTYFPQDDTQEESEVVTTTRTNETRIGHQRPPPPKRKAIGPPPKKKKQWVKGVVLIIVAALLAMVVFGPLNHLMDPFWGGPVYPERATFTIERTISMAPDEDIEYNINLPKPFNIPSNDIQSVLDVGWSVEPTLGERFGQDWYFWNGSVSGGDSYEIVIEYTMETSTVVWDYSSRRSGTVGDIDQDLKDLYNRDQWPLTDRDDVPLDRNSDGRNDMMIEPDHPEISALAHQIAGDKDNIYDQARAIYRWIVNNIEYERGEPGLPQHAYWTLQSRRGDCDEQAFLFISLARAIGLPAWIELGVMYDRVIDEWGGHGWIRMEFVDDGGNSGWVNIDTTNRQFFARDATRITTWVDDGIADHLENYYMFMNYTPGSATPNVEDLYVNLDMSTQGQVYIGDSDLDIPSIGPALMISSIVISSYLVALKKHKKR